MIDIPNWVNTLMYIVGAWVPPLIILLYIRGKKDADVDNFVKELRSMEKELENLTLGDGRGVTSAIQQDGRLDRLERDNEIFTRMRDDFIAFKARIELITRQLEQGVHSLNNSITSLNRMVGRLAAMDTSKITTFPPENHHQ